MLASLTPSNYKADIGTNGNFLLKHSVGSKPHNSKVIRHWCMLTTAMQKEVWKGNNTAVKVPMGK